MMLYISASLGVMVLTLAYACRKLWLETQKTGLGNLAFSLEKQLRKAGQILREQDDALSQVGELFVHVGVDLERTDHKQASEDLKRLGAILRTRHHHPGSLFDLAWAQKPLAEMGDRYGIEPVGGRLYCMPKLVQIAEEIMESVLDQRAAAEPPETRGTMQNSIQERHGRETTRQDNVKGHDAVERMVSVL